MPPKRKGRAAAAAKSQKRAKEDAAPAEKVENADKIEEEVKEEATGESKVADKVEAEADKAEAEKEKSDEEGDKGEKGEKGDKEQEKPKGKGRKKATPLVPGTKRVTRSNPAPKEEEEASATAAAAKKSVHIVIEHFKNPIFKRRADKVRDELLVAEAESELNVTVTFNPDKLKPAEGKFVIRDEAGRIFLELQDSKPFTKVKEMDAESVVEDILKQIS